MIIATHKNSGKKVHILQPLFKVVVINNNQCYKISIVAIYGVALGLFCNNCSSGSNIIFPLQ
jgi:hypothetical protein